MKLRIRGNSLRLRLTQPEMQALIRHGVLEDQIRFAPELAIVYRIVVAEDNGAPKVSLGGHSISVTISKAEADTWARSDQVGIYAAQQIGTADRLKIAIEKDFACLEPRADEDDSASFPNRTECRSASGEFHRRQR